MAENWSKGLSGVIKASKRAGPTSVALQNKAKKLAQKYYGTTDLKALAPYQLDKVITWVTGMSPEAGKSKSRKYQQALTGGKKYLNSNAKTYRAQKNK